MRLNRVLLFLGAILFLGSVYISSALRLSESSRPQQVFVNETNDHRFDESIQASILSAFSRTHVQNAVVITDRFAIDGFEREAAGLFKKLDLGRLTKGRAILYLYSPKNKSLKIETGYALESLLPDATVHSLERAAKSFIFSDHYQDFWAELINTLNIEIYQKEHGEIGEEPFDFSKMQFLSGGAGIVSHLYNASAKQLALESKKINSDTKSQFKASADLQVSLQNYLASLRAGIGDAHLPVLSSESRIFRGFTPLTTYQLYRNWHMMMAAGVERICQDDRFAFVFFRAKQPVLPLIFEIQQGRWKIQEPLSWSLFQRFEDSMQVYLKYPLQVNSAECTAFLRKTFSDPLYQEPAVELRQESSGLSYFYFRLYWLDRVASELDGKKLGDLPNNVLWMDLDTMSNLGRFSDFLRIMRELAARQPHDKKLADKLKFYEGFFKFSGPQWRLAI